MKSQLPCLYSEDTNRVVNGAFGLGSLLRDFLSRDFDTVHGRIARFLGLHSKVSANCNIVYLGNAPRC